MPDLAGLTVVVTRPAHQAENLCQAIEAAGGQVIRFPVLAIEDLARTPGLQQQLRQLSDYQLAIFISRNAVESTFHALPQAWPADLPCAAVGRATAKALQGQSCGLVLQAPEPYNSEALLTLPALNRVSGQRIIIFRGEGGREHLGETLRARGASVDYAECYRRVRPPAQEGALSAAWADIAHHVFVVSSNEALHNLYDMVGEDQRQVLLQAPLVVMSQRNAQLAQTLGFTQAARVAPNASDAGLLAAIHSWVDSMQHSPKDANP
jgi:uroporphyrinogen-III synthase